MLIKAGVDISRLKRPMRTALKLTERTMRQCKIIEDLVITSTYEGNHSAGSLHYANLAVDIRSKGWEIEDIEILKQNLGKKYDVVAEGSHIHIEYDPK